MHTMLHSEASLFALEKLHCSPHDLNIWSGEQDWWVCRFSFQPNRRNASLSAQMRRETALRLHADSALPGRNQPTEKTKASSRMRLWIASICGREQGKQDGRREVTVTARTTWAEREKVLCFATVPTFSEARNFYQKLWTQTSLQLIKI